MYKIRLRADCNIGKVRGGGNEWGKGDKRQDWRWQGCTGRLIRLIPLPEKLLQVCAQKLSAHKPCPLNFVQKNSAHTLRAACTNSGRNWKQGQKVKWFAEYFESPWGPGNLGWIWSSWWEGGPGDIARCRGASSRLDPSSKDESSSCLSLPSLYIFCKPTIKVFHHPALHLAKFPMIPYQKQRLDFDPAAMWQARWTLTGQKPSLWRTPRL